MTARNMTGPEVARYAVYDMQVCVPVEWSDEQAVEFGEQEYPCGTTHGWAVRKAMDERVMCDDKPGFVHLVLVA